jgi:cytochrome c-type biogenesis protein CcmH/NrfG
MVAAAVAALVGVGVGGFVLVGDIQFQNARLSGDRQASASAAHRLPAWPEVSDATARVVVYDAVVQRDDALLLEGVRWERRAVAFDRRDPRWWLLAGLVEAKAGRQAEASASLREVLRLNPYSCGAWGALRRMGQPVPTGDKRVGSLCSP